MYQNSRRRLYSQNFFCNRELLTKLIRRSSIGKNDTVLEIGPGRGSITEQLLATARSVIAVEVDSQLVDVLSLRFKNAPNFKIYRANILDFKLPAFPYKVFSNIPFIITAAVINKLTADSNMVDAYLFMQKEAAKKFVGMPYAARNSMTAVQLYPWFKLEIVWRFKRPDFNPRPNVDVVLVKIERRSQPLVAINNKRLYEAYVVYRYSHTKVSKLTFDNWLKSFDYFLKTSSLEDRQIVLDRANNYLWTQEKIQKIHRSRTDKNWRKY